MQTFDVYTMDGESFSIEMEGFSVTESGNEFELTDSLHGISNVAFLAFNEIAAIIPRNQEIRPKDKTTVEPIEFRVYLKKIGEPITIHASKFDKTTLKFYWQQRYSAGAEPNLVPELIRTIYLAPAAVVAVVPSSGLVGETPSRWP